MMEVEGGIVTHYNYILVIRHVIDFMSFSEIVCVLLFPSNDFPPQSLEYATYSCATLWLNNRRRVKISSSVLLQT